MDIHVNFKPGNNQYKAACFYNGTDLHNILDINEPLTIQVVKNENIETLTIKPVIVPFLINAFHPCKNNPTSSIILYENLVGCAKPYDTNFGTNIIDVNFPDTMYINHMDDYLFSAIAVEPLSKFIIQHNYTSICQIKQTCTELNKLGADLLYKVKGHDYAADVKMVKDALSLTYSKLQKTNNNTDLILFDFADKALYIGSVEAFKNICNLVDTEIDNKINNAKKYNLQCKERYSIGRNSSQMNKIRSSFKKIGFGKYGNDIFNLYRQFTKVANTYQNLKDLSAAKKFVNDLLDYMQHDPAVPELNKVFGKKI